MSETIKYPVQVLERFTPTAENGYTLVHGFSEKLDIKFVETEEPDTPVVNDTPKDIETPSATILPKLITESYVFSATSGMFTTFFIGPYSFNSISLDKLAELINANSNISEKGLVFEYNGSTLLIKATKEDITLDTFSWTYTHDITIVEDANSTPITTNNKSYSSITFISTQENVTVNPVEESEPIYVAPIEIEPEIPVIIPPEPTVKSLITDELIIYLNYDETFNQFKLGEIQLINTGLELILSDLHRLYPMLNAEILESGFGLRITSNDDVILTDLRLLPDEGKMVVVGEQKEGIQTQYPYPGVIYETILLQGVNKSEDTENSEDTEETENVPEVEDSEEDTSVIVTEPVIIEDEPEPMVAQYLEVRNQHTGGFQRYTLEQLVSGDLDSLHAVINTSSDTSITYNPEEWVFEINRYDSTEENTISIVVSIITVTTTYNGEETIKSIGGVPVTVNVYSSDVGKYITTPVINTASEITINLVKASLDESTTPESTPEEVETPVEEYIDEPTTSESESSEDTTYTETEEDSENPDPIEEDGVNTDVEPVEEQPEPVVEEETVPEENTEDTEETENTEETPVEDEYNIPEENTENSEETTEETTEVVNDENSLTLDKSISVAFANSVNDTDKLSLSINGFTLEGTMREIVDNFNSLVESTGLFIKAIVGAAKVLNIHSSGTSPVDINVIEIYGINSPVKVGINYEFGDEEYTIGNKFVRTEYLLGAYDPKPYLQNSADLNIEHGLNTIVVDKVDINNATLAIDGLVVANMIDDLKVGDESIKDELEVFLNASAREDGKFVLTNMSSTPTYVVLSVLETPDTTMPEFSENSTLLVSDREFGYNDLRCKVFEFVLDGNTATEETSE